MEKFSRVTNGFNFVYEKELEAGETVILDMPVVSANKRGINDIGWQTDSDDVILFGTLSSNPESDAALWQLIERDYEVNKTLSAIKIYNSGEMKSRIVIRAILN